MGDFFEVTVLTQSIVITIAIEVLFAMYASLEFVFLFANALSHIYMPRGNDEVMKELRKLYKHQMPKKHKEPDKKQFFDLSRKKSTTKKKKQ